VAAVRGGRLTCASGQSGARTFLFVPVFYAIVQGAVDRRAARRGRPVLATGGRATG
jgi:hypothetical protein